MLFALNESIGRIGDLKLAKENPGLFDADSFHIHYAKNPIIMYVHVIAGMIFLLTGVYQLIPYFRNKNIQIHKIIEKVFLALSFVVSISAIILALFMPFGDKIESVSNLIFGLFILFSTIKAYTTIKQKKVIEHSNWVRRIFFISLSIATIRLIMIVTMILTDETVQEVMGRSFLIGFILHTLIIELGIITNSKKEKIQINPTANKA